jgi:hypothetical protein
MGAHGPASIYLRRLGPGPHGSGQQFLTGLGWSRVTWLFAFCRLAAQLQLSAEDSEHPSSCVVLFFAPAHHSLFRSAIQHVVRCTI